MIRPLSELWPAGRRRGPFAGRLALVQLLGGGPVSGGLRLAWSESHQLRLALGEHGG